MTQSETDYVAITTLAEAFLTQGVDDDLIALAAADVDAAGRARSFADAPPSLVADMLASFVHFTSDPQAVASHLSARSDAGELLVVRRRELKAAAFVYADSLWARRVRNRLSPTAGSDSTTGAFEQAAEVDRLMVTASLGPELLARVAALENSEKGSGRADWATATILSLAPFASPRLSDGSLDGYVRDRMRDHPVDRYEGLVAATQELCRNPNNLSSAGRRPFAKMARFCHRRLTGSGIDDYRLVTAFSFLSGEPLWEPHHRKSELWVALDEYTVGNYDGARERAIELLSTEPVLFEALELLALCNDRDPSTRRARDGLTDVQHRAVEDLEVALSRSRDVERAAERLSSMSTRFSPTELGAALFQAAESARAFDQPADAGQLQLRALYSTALTPRMMDRVRAFAPDLSAKLSTRFDRWGVSGYTVNATRVYMGDPQVSAQSLPERIPAERRRRLQAAREETQGSALSASHFWRAIANDTASSTGARHDAALRSIWLLLDTKGAEKELVEAFASLATQWSHLATKALASRVLLRVISSAALPLVERMPHWSLVVWRANAFNTPSSADGGYTTYKAVARYLQTVSADRPEYFVDAEASESAPAAVLAEICSNVLRPTLLSHFGMDAGGSEAEYFRLRARLIDRAIELRKGLDLFLSDERQALKELELATAGKHHGQQPEIVIDADALITKVSADVIAQRYGGPLLVLAQTDRLAVSSRGGGGGVRRQLAAAVLEVVRGVFLFLPRYGLDWQLSFQVRHTRALSLLRASFRKILGKEESGAYGLSPFMATELPALGIVDAEHSEVASAIVVASRGIDACLRRVTTEWLQVSLDDHVVADGFLDLTEHAFSTDAVLKFAQVSRTPAELWTNMIQDLRQRADAGLRRISERIKSDLPGHIEPLLEKLRYDIRSNLSSNSPAARRLLRHIDESEKSLREAASTLAQWVQLAPLSTRSPSQSSFEQLVVEVLSRVAGEDLLETDRLRGALRLKKTRWRVPGRVYPVLLDMLESLFSNVYRHSDFQRVQLTLRRHKGALVISLSNSLTTKRLDEVQTMLSSLRLEIARASQSEPSLQTSAAAARDGKSGLLKVLMAMRYELGDPAATLDVMCRDGHFVVVMRINARAIGYANPAR